MFRFTPTFAKDLDIKDLKVAIFNYLMAKKSGEKFVVRINDNAQNNSAEALEILKHFGINFDDIVYQSSNLKFYHQFATKLLIDKKAFSCFCSKKELEEKEAKAKANGKPYRYDGTCEKLSDMEVLDNEKPFCIRIKKPQSKICFDDKLKGKVCLEGEEIDSFVILEYDKSPTENFSSAIDDMLMDVSFIIRDESELLETPRQILIREYIGYDKKIEYVHLSSIKNAEFSIKELLEFGFLPDAINNYLILLGYKTPCKIFNLTEAIEWFEIENLSKNEAEFDLEKLKDINKEHIKLSDSKSLAKAVGFGGDESIGNLVKFFTKEASTLKEIKEEIELIFSKKSGYKKSDFEVDRLLSLAKEAPFFEEFDEFEKYLLQKSGLKGKAFFMPLKYILSGSFTGTNPKDLYPYIKNYLGEIIK